MTAIAAPLTTSKHFDLAHVYARQQHKRVNQMYDKTKPYSYHLELVEWYAKSFSELIGESWDSEPNNYWLVLAGAWCHDLLEDTGITYNDLKQAVNGEVAELAYLLQTPKGRNRKERHCDAYYQEMATNREAVYVKLCDRIANVQYSLDQKSSMFGKYKQEQAHFEQFIRAPWPELEPMWQHLEKLLRYEPYTA